MDSIQQIVKNVMCKVTEIVTEQRTDGIKGMARDIQAAVNTASLEMMKLLLIKMDNEIYHSEERKINWEPVRKDDAKTIMTCVGELTYTRRYYRDKKSGGYLHLLDAWLGITPHQQIGEDVREALVRSSVDISYQKSGERAAPEHVSKTSVGRYVRDVQTEHVMCSDGIKRVCRELYVEADEDHVPLQEGKTTQVRLVYVHDGNVSDTKRAQLEHVRYLTWPIGGDTDDMWETVATYIEEQYDTDKLQRIWLMGDGAEWIRKGREWLIKCRLLIDKYHINKRFMSLTAQIPHLRPWGRKIMSGGTKEQFHELFERAYEESDTKNKKAQVLDDARYIISHWEHIEVGRDPDAPGCSAEGHVSHVLSARLSSRPMGWSREGLQQMAGLRVMRANGRPIVYDRRKTQECESSKVMTQKILCSVKRNMRNSIISEIKNVRLPVIAAGKYTPTYMALKGLAHADSFV